MQLPASQELISSTIVSVLLVSAHTSIINFVLPGISPQILSGSCKQKYSTAYKPDQSSYSASSPRILHLAARARDFPNVGENVAKLICVRHTPCMHVIHVSTENLASVSGFQRKEHIESGQSYIHAGQPAMRNVYSRWSFDHFTSQP